MSGVNMWGGCIDGWVAWLRAKGLSRHSIRTRRGHVAVAGKLVGKPVGQVCVDDLVVMQRPEWSVEHRRGMRTSLIQFFDWCARQGLVEGNPALGLPRVSESAPKPRPAPEWLWRELVDSAPARELLMIRLAGEAGLRRGEIARVHRDDVVWDGEGYSLIVRGKGDKQRVVPLNDRLAEQLQRGGWEWVPPGHVGFVFPAVDQWGNVVGDHLSADRVGRLISGLMPVGWSAHKLRHRFATRGFAVTRNLRAVQEALGHASVATTQRYTAVGSADVRAVVEAAAS